MSNKAKLAELALNGGPKTRTKPFPARFHFGQEEKDVVNAIFDKAIQTGEPTGYNGAEETQYCKDFAEFLGGGYADGVNSGTTAVFVALKAINPEPFTEIIVSPITDPGGMMPITMLNCIPVVADSAPGKYNTSAAEIEKLISPLTSAIVVAHIGGEPTDIDNIVALGKKHGIPVVEDCAQCHGAKLNGKYLGTFGDIAAFSTMFGKHHCTGGQGGVVFTKSEALYWKVRQSADRGKPFGLPAGSNNCVASLNFNLSDLAASMGIVQLKKLTSIVERRRNVVAKMTELFKNETKSIIVPPQLEGAEASYWWWRLEVDVAKLSCDKMEFCKALSAEGMPVNALYRSMPHTMDWFKNRNVFGTSGLPWSAPQYKGEPNREFPCPNAIAATEVQFNLTIFESWGEEEINDIIAAIKKVEAAYLK